MKLQRSIAAAQDALGFPPTKPNPLEVSLSQPPTRSPLAPEVMPEASLVKGARWGSAAAGLRYRGRRDLMLLELAPGTTAAGVFTRSAVPSHPVPWSQGVVARGRARAVIVNAGNANVFRGREGDDAVRAEAEAVAGSLNCTPEEVVVASTGVIGERLPVEAIVARVPELVAALDAGGLADAAGAIMTTDTYPKWSSRRLDLDGATVAVAGIAKGSGMYAPNMATMLAFVVTDAAVAPSLLQGLIAEVADRTFNATTVDGDTSTSDTLCLFATGGSGAATIEDASDPRWASLSRAVEDVCHELALMIVRDGEGATKLIEITVGGAEDDGAARRVGLAIANSPLVKTAIAGEDANWGRVVMAIGKAGERVEVERLGISFGGVEVARDGGAVPDLDEAPVAEHLRGREVVIEAVIGGGPGRATVWTCDLTYGYIAINADYRS